jgi:tetratricopeptide (TPR) repeat protein
MRLFYGIVLTIFFVSCASTPEKREDKYEAKFKDIKEKDFNKNTPKRYSSRNDYHPVSAKKNLRPFLRESLAIVPIKELKGIDTKKDTIAQISKLCNTKETSEGLKLAKKDYEKYQSFPSYWMVVGNCYYQRNKLFMAQLYYSRALSLAPGSGSTYNNYAVTLLRRGKKDRALVALKKAISKNKKLLTAKLNLAHLYLQYGVYDQAISQWKKLEKEMPYAEVVINGLATSYLMKGWYKNAKKYYAKLKNTRNAEIGVNYALNEALSGNKKNALKLIEKVNEYPSKKWKLHKESVEKYIRKMK